jgi:hypothetical protein
MMPITVDKRVQAEIFDDFFYLDTAATNGAWAVVKGTGGALAVNTTKAGGWINIPTAASASDYQLLATQQKFFNPLKSGWLEASILVTEASTNSSNWAIGLSSITTTGWMVASSAGPPTSFDGAAIFKTGGAMAVKGITSVTTTQTTSATIATAVTAVGLRLGIHWDANDGVTARVRFLVNGVVQATQNVTIGTNNLFPFMTMMAAAGGTAETLNVDYFRCVVDR